MLAAITTQLGARPRRPQNPRCSRLGTHSRSGVGGFVWPFTDALGNFGVVVTMALARSSPSTGSPLCQMVPRSAASKGCNAPPPSSLSTGRLPVQASALSTSACAPAPCERLVRPGTCCFVSGSDNGQRFRVQVLVAYIRYCSSSVRLSEGRYNTKIIGFK